MSLRVPILMTLFGMLALYPVSGLVIATATMPGLVGGRCSRTDILMHSDLVTYRA